MEDYKFSPFNYQLKGEIDVFNDGLKALEEELAL